MTGSGSSVEERSHVGEGVPGRPRYRYSVEQYLSFERGSPSKHDYFAGDIYSFIGANQAHCLIATNLIVAFRSRLPTGPYTLYMSQMRLRVERTGLHAYPDAMVVHGRGSFADDRHDMLTDPQVIIEIVSPETAEYDRGSKFEHYETIGSLKEYLLIDQEVRRFEHHVRRPDGRWSTVTVTDPAGAVRLPSIGCELPLDEIYDGIELLG